MAPAVQSGSEVDGRQLDSLERGQQRGQHCWTAWENLLLACAVKSGTDEFSVGDWVHLRWKLDWKMIKNVITDRLGTEGSWITQISCLKQYFRLVSCITQGTPRESTWGDEGDTNTLIQKFAKLRLLELNQQLLEKANKDKCTAEVSEASVSSLNSFYSDESESQGHVSFKDSEVRENLSFAEFELQGQKIIVATETERQQNVAVNVNDTHGQGNVSLKDSEVRENLPMQECELQDPKIITSNETEGQQNVAVYVNDTQGQGNVSLKDSEVRENLPMQECELQDPKIITSNETEGRQYVAVNDTEGQGNLRCKDSEVREYLPMEECELQDPKIITSNETEGQQNVAVYVNDTEGQGNLSCKDSEVRENLPIEECEWQGPKIITSNETEGQQNVNVNDTEGQGNVSLTDSKVRENLPMQKCELQGPKIITSNETEGRQYVAVNDTEGQGNLSCKDSEVRENLPMEECELQGPKMITSNETEGQQNVAVNVSDSQGQENVSFKDAEILENLSLEECKLQDQQKAAVNDTEGQGNVDAQVDYMDHMSEERDEEVGGNQPVEPPAEDVWTGRSGSDKILLLCLWKKIKELLGPSIVTNREFWQHDQQGIKSTVTLNIMKNMIMTGSIKTVTALKNTVSLMFLNAFMKSSVDKQFEKELLELRSQILSVLKETAECKLNNYGDSNS